MMATKVKKVFAMALVLVALTSIFVPVASAGGTQTWYLKGDATRTLDKTLGTPVPDCHNLAKNVYEDWNAGAAQCALTMGTGTWTLYLHYAAPCDGILVIEIRNRGTGELLASYNMPILEGAHENGHQAMAATARSFSSGDILTLWLKWMPSSGSSPLGIGYSLSTRLTSPESDPGYPVPEMSTLALFSVGLLALVGYVMYRRRGI